MNDADQALVNLAALFDDPLCKVILEKSSNEKGNPQYEVISFVPESAANAFVELWKTTDYKSDHSGRITLTGLKGSYTSHYSNIFGIKIEHM